MAEYPVLTVQIAFTTDPLLEPSWTTVGGLREFSVTRGRQHELDRVEAGSAVVVLDDRARNLDPNNTAGAYYPNVLPMRRIRITATYNGTEYPRYAGYIRSWSHGYEPANRDAYVRLDCVDAFAAFGLFSPSSAAGTWLVGDAARGVLGTTTRLGFSSTSALPSAKSGSLVNSLLDLYGWPSADRDIDTGVSTLQGFVPDGNLMDHLQLIADSESALLYMSRDGKVSFHDRTAVWTEHTVSQGTFGVGGHGYQEISPEFSDADIRNDITVTRAGDTDVFRAAGSDSINSYLDRTYERTDLLLSTDGEAQDLANYLLTRYAEPMQRFPSVGLVCGKDSSTARFTQVLERDIHHDRITVVHQPPGGGSPISTAQHIEGITETAVPGGPWTVRWSVIPAAQFAYWILGDATAGVLDSTTRIGF